MSRFLEEIHQQPAALRTVLGYYCREGKEALQAVCDLWGAGEKRLLFTGMGSSHYAPLAIRRMLVAARVPAEIWEAGELLHYHLEVCTGQTMVVAISQSGESAETCGVVEKVRESCPVVTLTNAPESYLGRCGDVVLPLCAGEEAAISTKTYTNTLAVLHLLATALANGELEAAHERLGRLANDMETWLTRRREELVRAADFLAARPFLYFIARGPSLAAAHQGALTFNEGARLPTGALAGGTFRHGPFELVGEEFAAVFDIVMLCKFLRGCFADAYEEIPVLYSLTTGIEMTPDDLRKAAERAHTIKKAFNIREGWKKEDDWLPPRFMKDPIKEGASKGSYVKPEELRMMIDTYYEARGWTPEGLIPKEKLVELGLDDIAEELGV